MAFKTTGHDTGDVVTRELDQLGSSIYSQNKHSTQILQADRLTKRFAITLPVALVIASLHYGEVAR
jgi:hypothetical protein